MRIRLKNLEIRITKRWYGFFRSRIINAFSVGFVHFVKRG